MLRHVRLLLLMSPPVVKSTRLTSSTMKIGTHDGPFHCDDVLACWMLKRLPTYADAEIVRSREKAILETCDVVVDVGGIYDPATFRFDHHQRSFNTTLGEIRTEVAEKFSRTKLSSVGLVYAHFGKEVLKTCVKEEKVIDILYAKMYESFLEDIDANDNGISICGCTEKRYAHNGTSLASRVGNLTPPWNAKDKGPEALLAGFHKAMELAGGEFHDRLLYYANSWLPAKQLVTEGIKSRKSVHASGRIMELPQGGIPWKEHFFTVESELQITGEILYAIYHDEIHDKWMCYAVPLSRDTFDLRHGLPEQWRGLRDDVLSTKSGIPGCVFVHANGFCGGNATRDGLLAMLDASLPKQQNGT